MERDDQSSIRDRYKLYTFYFGDNLCEAADHILSGNRRVDRWFLAVAGRCHCCTNSHHVRHLTRLKNCKSADFKYYEGPKLCHVSRWSEQYPIFISNFMLFHKILISFMTSCVAFLISAFKHMLIYGFLLDALSCTFWFVWLHFGRFCKALVISEWP